MTALPPGPMTIARSDDLHVPIDPLDARPVLDLRRLVQTLWQYKRAIVAIIGGTVAVGLLITFLLTPRYSAYGTLQVDQEEQRILASQQEAPAPSLQDSERFLNTAVDVLRSRRMAQRTAAELGLMSDDRFLTLMKVKLREAPQSRENKVREDATIRAIADNLSVSLSNDSRVVTVGFSSPDPEFSARFVNTFIANFLRYNIERKLDKTTYARDFLSGQLEEARQRLQRAERSANDYARSSGVVRVPSTTPGTAESTLTAVDLSQYNQALATARTARIAAESRWAQVRSAPDLAIPEVIQNQALQTLYGDRAKLAAQLRQELVSKQPEHPQVVPLQRQLNEYDRQIETLTAGVRRSIRDEYQAALQREETLRSRVGSLVSNSERDRDRSVQLNTLLREVETSRQLYDGLLQRFREMSAEANITANNVQQIDLAEPPVRPTSPRPLLNLALSLLAGAALAAIYIFLREQIDDRLRGPQDIERRLGLKLLGVTPIVANGETPEAALSDPKSPLSEAIYSLRTALQFATPDGLPTRLLITSSRKEEGKSSTTAGIARAIGDLGRRVVIIDADLRRPTVHHNLGIGNDVGLVELLSERASIGDVLRPTSYTGVSVITSGAAPANPTDILASHKFANLLDQLGERFDTILLDSPPVLGLADAVILSGLRDVSTVLLADAATATRGRLRHAMRRLEDGGARIVGAIYSRHDFTKAGLAQDDYAYADQEYYAYEAKA